MIRQKKAQVSIEAMSLTGFLVLFLVMGMGFFMIQFSNSVNAKDNELISQISEIVVSEMQMARSAEPGYERVFYIPYTVDLKEIRVAFPHLSAGGMTLSPAEGQVFMIRADNSILVRNLLLGNDVSGALYNGNNHVMKSETGILLIPENIDELILERPGEINPTVAYTRIIRDNNYLTPLNVNSSVRCEVGIVNADPTNDLRVQIFYRFESDVGSVPDYHVPNMVITANPDADEINGIHYSDNLTIRDMYSDVELKGYNISCVAQLYPSGPQVQSLPLLIEDSIPHIQITNVYAPPMVMDEQTEAIYYSWEVQATVSFGDYDYEDNKFNITFIAEGQNAGYLECVSGCKPTNLPEGSPHTITFKYSVPTDIGSCNQVDTFGFKVRVENSRDPERTSTASKLFRVSC